MKTKKIIALAIMATALPLSSFAGDNEKVKIKGSGRIRSVGTDNYDFDSNAKDKNNYTTYRFRVGANFKTSNKNSVFFQPSFNKTAGDTTGGQSSGALKDPTAFNVHQAYIEHVLGDKLTMKVGRQELAYGEHLIIGNVGWDDVGRSFDGYKFSYASKFGKTDLLAMTLKENGVESTTNRDRDLKGIYHSGSFGAVKSADFYYLIDSDLTTKSADTDKTITTTGFRVKSVMGGMDYRVEYATQSIKTGSNSENGSQYDVELGYTMNKLRAAVEVSSASEFYEQLYPTAHKWMGMADLFWRQNIDEKVLHLNYKHSDALKFFVSYHIFSIVNTNNTRYKWKAPATTGTEKDLGNEIDVRMSYDLDENLNLIVGYFTFTPGKRYKDANLKDTQNFSYLQIVSKF